MAQATASLPIRFARAVFQSVPWIIPLAIGAAAIISDPPAIGRLRDLLFDGYQRLSPRSWSPDLPVRIVAIDDATIAKVGQWPWPRDKVADLIDRLREGNPAAVALDIVFSEADRLSPEAILRQIPDIPEKPALAKALAGRADLASAFRAAPTVAAMALVNDGAAAAVAPKTGFVVVGEDGSRLPPAFARAIVPLPDLRDAALGLGAINYVPDRDLTVRRAPLIFAVGPDGARQLVPSLAAEALRVAQFAPLLRDNFPADSPIVTTTGAAIVSVRIGNIEIPTESDGQVRIRFAGRQSGRTISAAKVLEGDVAAGDLDGRIILVGVTAASLGDIRSTPLDAAVPGVEIQAEVLEHALSGAKLTRPDFAPGVELLVLVVGGLLTVAASRRLRPLPAALAVLCLMGVAGAASWVAFQQVASLYDPLTPSAAWLATWSAVTVVAFRRTETERRSVRQAFSRYLAPAVVERLAADPGSLKLGGEARTLTVLFCDVRDFTARSEDLSAEEVVDFLHALLTPLTDAVLREAGTIDKYLGDGLMAFWNAPLDVPDHATRACRAALAMQRAIPAIDALLATRAKAAGRRHRPVRIGIGVNTGDAFVGNMGAEQRFDYSIIGDPVNVAARLESATKEFAVPIVVSEATMRATTGMRFVDLGIVAMKGRVAPARAYALHDEDPGHDDGHAVFLDMHRKILAVENPQDLPPLLATVRTHPFARSYAEFYARLEERVARSSVP